MIRSNKPPIFRPGLIIKDLLFYIRDKVLLRKKISILMYHSVGYNSEFFNVTPENFEWQMNHIKERGFNVIPLGSLIQSIIMKEEIPEKSVAITFDDGYEDNYTEALPVLKKHNFPATVFLATGRLGDKNYTNKRGHKLPMLDWDQIRTMHDSGLIDFEPHTVSHPRLSQLQEEEVRREMAESKEAIEKTLGKKCPFFAYPKGDYNDKVVQIAKELFGGAVGVDRGFVSINADRFKLNRNSIDSATDNLMFALKL